MSNWSLLLAELVAIVCRHVAAAARVLAAPAPPVYRGPAEGWVPAPHTLLPLLPGPVWTLLTRRLHRLAHRLTRLHERWLAGTLPKPRPRPTSKRPDSPHRPPARLPEYPQPGHPLVDAPARLPRGFGWVIRRLPSIGAESGRLHGLLQTTLSREFVEQVPQAGRHLRPLCQALGVEQPAWLKLPPRPRRPRKPRPARPRRWKLTDPELKLRPYEIAAARYFLKKYGRD